MSKPARVPRCVLIVEDDDGIRECLAELLSEAGWRVMAASNGQHALALLNRRVRPDLLLLDLMMPVMDGWALMDALKARPELASIPVVVLSAATPLPRGDFETLGKPFQLDALFGVLVRHLGMPPNAQATAGMALDARPPASAPPRARSVRAAEPGRLRRA